mgnify:CR=1 FL=1
MNWPIWLFILAVVGTVLLLLRTKKVLLVTVLALVVYLAVHFHVWFWVSWVFWLLICLSVVFLVIMKRRLVYSTGAAALVVALLAAASAVVGGVNFWSDDSAGSPATTTTGTDSSVPVTETATPTPDDSIVDTSPPVQLDAETRDALKIEFSNVSCPDVVESAGGEVIHLSNGTVTYQMKDESLVPVGEGGRLRSDMMALPMVNQEDPKVSLDEVILATCQGTLYGATLAHLFTILPFGDQMLIDLEDNPWLLPYAGNTDQINDLALKAVYTIDGKSGYYVKPDYQTVAENLAELLIRATLSGFAPEQSTANYHLLNGGMVVDMFSEVGHNPTQENLLALVLTIDQKTGECLSKIGFNVFDKRPEIFSCYPSTTTTTPCSTNCGTTPTTEVGRKGTPATTTPPPPTTQPSGPTTTLQCVYGTHRDPATGGCVTTPPVVVEPPGTIPSTSTPPGPGTTVLGP